MIIINLEKISYLKKEEKKEKKSPSYFESVPGAKLFACPRSNVERNNQVHKEVVGGITPNEMSWIPFAVFIHRIRKLWQNAPFPNQAWITFRYSHSQDVEIAIGHICHYHRMDIGMYRNVQV